MIVEEKKKELTRQKPQPVADVIVSLTSYRQRFANLTKVFDSIYANTMQPLKIVLTIESKDKEFIPKPLLDYIDSKKNIEIIEYPENLKCHLKYFCVMKKYRKYPIITIDDDVIYTPDLISSLYAAYKANPNCVCARRVHLITYTNRGTIKKYDDWIGECTAVTNPSTDLFATGVGGVLYPPDILKISDENLGGIKNCIYADDIYLKYLEDLYKVPVLWVKNSRVHGKKKIIENQKLALSKENVLNKRNDEYIKKFLNNKKQTNVAKEEPKVEVVKFIPKGKPKPIKKEPKKNEQKKPQENVNRTKKMPVTSLRFLKDVNRRIGLIRT
jgi:hypothetical protein